MSGCQRLLLVGLDLRLAHIIQAQLQRTHGEAPSIIRFEEIFQRLTPETDGAVILLASDISDVNSIQQIVRESRIQCIPVSFGVVTTEGNFSQGVLNLIRPYVDGIWFWPQHLREVIHWAQRGFHRGVPFPDPLHESLNDRIRRRLISQTPSLVGLADQIGIAAAHDVTVLIEGETGTGKTYLARLIHECSPRRDNRFLVVACGTLNGNLIASEFFGHVKGAFTGADANKIGKFAAAGQGTILLDEIDSLSLEHQANLLRVIETGEFEPVGSNETQISRARIIAATNWNLLEAVERGVFRRDLYYRLHVISFHLPPLRDRPQDIGPLARGMIARYSTKYHKHIVDVDEDALRLLESQPWPGNIRQLENVIQQAVLNCTGHELKVLHLPTSLLTNRDSVSTPTTRGTVASFGTLKQNRETNERTNILRALEKTNHSRTRAAQLLGVSRVTLYKKMKKYGLLSRANGQPENIMPCSESSIKHG